MKKGFRLTMTPLIISAFVRFCMAALFFVLMALDPELSRILFSYEMTDEVFFGFTVTVFWYFASSFLFMVCKIIHRAVLINRGSPASPTEEVPE